ncbi:MAG: hypothetical protein DRP42_00585 [Tenericutes bacterium]|nr:MAG: hypothetical protein DRP42_00585 [Mycoplasmatota bacterium]
MPLDVALLEVDRPNRHVVLVAEVQAHPRGLVEDVRAEVQPQVIVAGVVRDPMELALERLEVEQLLVRVGNVDAVLRRGQLRLVHEPEVAGALLVVGVEDLQQGRAVVDDPSNGERSNDPARDEVRPTRADLEDALELLRLADSDVLENADRKDHVAFVGGVQGSLCLAIAASYIGESRRPCGDQGGFRRDELSTEQFALYMKVVEVPVVETRCCFSPREH